MNNSIFEKAERLGIKTSSGNSIERLEEIAYQLGLDFNPNDLSNIENALNNELTDYEKPAYEEQPENLEDNYESESGSSSNRNYRKSDKEKYGEKEYKNALDDNGKYDKDYYKKKGEDLESNLQKAKDERNNPIKKKNPKDTEPIKADGSNTAQKNWFDKRRDDLNYLKAKNDVRKNDIAGKRAERYRKLHPFKTGKQQLKGTINEGLKKTGKTALNTGKKVGKKAGKTAVKAGKATAKAVARLVAKLALNPKILLIIIIAAVVLLLLACFIFFMIPDDGDSGSSSSGNGKGYYANPYNEIMVDYEGYNDGQNFVMPLSEFILRSVTLGKDNGYSDEQLKALLIMTKTNILAEANYKKGDKMITGKHINYEVEDEDYKARLQMLYEEVKDYLYLSEDYTDEVIELTKDDILSYKQGIYNNNELNYEELLKKYVFKSEKGGFTSNYNLALYDTSKYAIFYEYSEYNTDFWWPIGSSEVTSGDNIYGGTPTSTTVSSPYGMRMHPIDKVEKMHNGIDISAGCDEVLIAVKSGEVTSVVNGCEIGASDCGGGYGNYVVIKHSDEITSLYAHMKNGSATVNVGDYVVQGEKIGLVGTTGKSTGCHLHFEIRNNGSRVDPLGYVFPSNPRANKSES